MKILRNERLAQKGILYSLKLGLFFIFVASTGLAVVGAQEDEVELLLAENVPRGATVHLAILESFQHVDLELGGGGGLGAFFESVAEVRRLFSITYDLLAQGLL